MSALQAFFLKARTLDLAISNTFSINTMRAHTPPTEGDGSNNDGDGICVGPTDVKKDKAMIKITQLGGSV